MLRIDRNKQTFELLDTPSLSDVSITERYDLQECIANSPNAFFSELGLNLFVIGKELLPSKNVQDRIDLLCVDHDGALVIVELKRGNHKLHLLQAISYAAMISKWTSDEILELLDDDAQERLAEFLNVETDDLNNSQKVVLIAEAFDYSVLISAEWLSESYGVGISCCRISIAKDPNSGVEYLVCANVYPAPELANEAVRRGRNRTATSRWTDRTEAMKNIENPEVVAFYKQAIEEGVEAYLRKRCVYFRVDGKRRWFVSARKSRAYCWQYARFDGDVEYWKQGLSPSADVKEVNDGRCLSFLLTTKDDYDYFRQGTLTLTSVTWHRPFDEDEPQDDE